MRHLGRELNAGSPVPPRSLPGSGVRVDAERWAASRLEVLEPVSGSDTGQLAVLATARVLVAASGAAELALELRADAAGSPGAPLGPPLVTQLETGATGWVELPLNEPLPVEPGPLWIVLRTTRGALHWYGEEAGAARISLDRGETWGDVDPLLTAAVAPLAQLYHRLPDPLPRPSLVAQLGDMLLAADLLAGAARTGPAEYELEVLEVPSALLEAIGATTGSGRTETVLSLFSTAVADLTLEDAALSYDPYAV